MQKQSLIRWLAIALVLTPLAGCMGSVSYTPFRHVHISTPYHIPYGHQRRANLPNGGNGHYKTGKPYRVAGYTYYPLTSASGYDRTGIASWYGSKFHGRKTANGEYFDMHALSAAHRTLPLPTLVRVTNLDNGRKVVVRVNDRGPFVKGRLIDLSYAAAKALGYAKRGTAHVRVQTLSGNQTKPAPVLAQRHPATKARQTSTSQSPSLTLSTSHTAGMYVQLGAFAARKNAAKLSASLKPEYPNVQIRPVARAMQTLYRVRIGPFSNVQDIERTVLTLKNTGHEDTVVTIE
ncbi:MAG TPA: septal ring lytic transglycosylase RlpA family protein [Mariprofundaceae bacterium]|nr:septal ring lytic transglycosylase RlpA family protein [Mariprofundaceae bacterium]